MARHGKQLSPAYWATTAAIWPTMQVLTKRDYRGLEHLHATYPPNDGIVVAANHLSWFDPFVLCHVTWSGGRPPHIMVKESLFHMPGFGRVLTSTRQIPVMRGGVDAARSVAAAVAAVRSGEAVMLYPEGTITRDPQLWPMHGRTGAARIALTADAPVIPLAQWGPQEVMRPYHREFRVFPRKTMHVLVGEPVDLDDLRGRELTSKILATATKRIIDRITELLAELRGEEPPAQRLDFRAHSQGQVADQPTGAARPIAQEKS